MHQTHGMTHTRLYSIWKNMKHRCGNPKDPKYGSYGGKGIRVCDEWKNNFLAFYEWAISNGYKDPDVKNRLDLYWYALTLDRIDEKKDYEPSNCRWIPFNDNRNRRSTGRRCSNNNTANILSTVSISLSDLARKTKISKWRISKAMLGEEMLFSPMECIRLAAALNSTVDELF